MMIDDKIACFSACAEKLETHSLVNRTDHLPQER